MKTIDELTSTCTKYEPTVAKIVHAALDRNQRYFPTSQDVFAGQSVCGEVSRVLGYFLHQEGYTVRITHSPNLGEMYSPQDHAFLVVETAEDEVIVDGAYLQFIDLFTRAADTKLKPINILPFTELEQTVSQLVDLYHRFLELFPLPAKLYGLDKLQDEIESYFRGIWDYKQPHFESSSPNLLQEELELYIRYGEESLGKRRGNLLRSFLDWKRNIQNREKD